MNVTVFLSLKDDDLLYHCLMGHGSNLYTCQTWLRLRLYCSLVARGVLVPGRCCAVALLPYKAVLCCNRALQLSNEFNKGSSWTGIPGPPTPCRYRDFRSEIASLL
jgi:hypothetical protein